MAQHLSKAVCLASLARSFEAGARLTSRDVARRYAVSLRTAHRWIIDVDSIVPLVEAKDGHHVYYSRYWK